MVQELDFDFRGFGGAKPSNANGDAVNMPKYDKSRAVIPQDMPLLVRISATDWAAGGWDLEQTVVLSRLLKEHSVDLMDVSTGGTVSGVTVPVKPKYQMPFAAEVRARAF